MYEWLAQVEAAEQREAALRRAAVRRHQVVQGTDLRTRVVTRLLGLGDRLRAAQDRRVVAAGRRTVRRSTSVVAAHEPRPAC